MKKGFRRTLEYIYSHSLEDECGCWIWQGYCASGYPSIGKKNNRIIVHRLSWEIKNGRPMREGFAACHTCDVKRCVNPDHIYEGTYKQNTNDAIRTGTHRIFGRSTRRPGTII